jgi:hypothetical protein
LGSQPAADDHRYWVARTPGTADGDVSRQWALAGKVGVAEAYSRWWSIATPTRRIGDSCGSFSLVATGAEPPDCRRRTRPRRDHQSTDDASHGQRQRRPERAGDAGSTRTHQAASQEAPHQSPLAGWAVQPLHDSGAPAIATLQATRTGRCLRRQSDPPRPFAAGRDCPCASLGVTSVGRAPEASKRPTSSPDGLPIGAIGSTGPDLDDGCRAPRSTPLLALTGHGSDGRTSSGAGDLTRAVVLSGMTAFTRHRASAPHCLHAP